MNDYRDIAKWYEDHYHEMSGYGKWFQAEGLNLLAPEAWSERRYRILIVRLSTQRDTAASFTHRLLYQIAASCDNVFVDCAWLPPPADAALFDQAGIPWMTGVATRRPALDFDCIALSNSIILELINIPLMLIKSSIPAKKSDRMGRSDVPMVILGGANALFSSVLCGTDPPVDIIFAGEDCASVKKIVTLGRDSVQNGEDKRDLLRHLRDIPGIIEPDGLHPTRKNQPDRSGLLQMRNAPVFAGEENAGSGSLQISEGCPCFCTFCAEAWSRKPYR